MNNLDTGALDKLFFQEVPKGKDSAILMNFPSGTSAEVVQQIADVLNQQAKDHVPLATQRQGDEELNKQLTKRYFFNAGRSVLDSSLAISVDASDEEKAAGRRADTIDSPAIAAQMLQVGKEATGILKAAAQALKDQKREEGQKGGKQTWYSRVMHTRNTGDNEAVMLPIEGMDVVVYAKLREKLGDFLYQYSRQAVPEGLVNSKEHINVASSGVTGGSVLIVTGTENIDMLMQTKVIPADTREQFFCAQHRSDVAKLVAAQGSNANPKAVDGKSSGPTIDPNASRQK